VSKQLLPVKIILFYVGVKQNCNGYLITGYKAGGIKAAGILHRLICGTWDVSLLMCQKLCRKFFFRKRLFNKSFTVHTATQFQLSWEKQQEASDEAIVAMKFL
jgi:hypothetical protein